MYKKTLRYLFFIALITFMNSSCMLDECGGSKERFINKFENFVEEIDKADLNYSDDEWEKLDVQFESYIDNCYERYEEEMTVKEIKQFWRSSMKYYYQRFGTGIARELFGKGNGTLKKLRKKLEKFKDEDLEDAMDDLKSETKRLQEELEELREALQDK